MENKLFKYEDYLPNGLTFKELETKIAQNQTYTLDKETVEKLYGDYAYNFDINNYPEIVDALKSYVNIYQKNNPVKYSAYVEDWKNANKKEMTIIEALKALSKDKE